MIPFSFLGFQGSQHLNLVMHVYHNVIKSIASHSIQSKFHENIYYFKNLNAHPKHLVK